jgi:hypothetical protein
MVRGGLAEIEDSTMGLNEPREKVGRKPSAAAALSDRELPLVLSTACANEYATPTHSARTTTVYSVSFPVWAEWSHWSNNSTNGQAKQIKTSPAASVNRNRMYESILPPSNSRHRNYGSLGDSHQSILDLGLICFRG